MQKRGSFWKPFRSERISQSQKLLKSAKKDFYANFSSFWTKLNYEKLFLLRSDIPGLLVNTLTTNLKYCHSNRETLRLPIQIKLSKKPEIFFDFFFFFLDYYLHFRQLQYICNVLKKTWASLVKYLLSYWLRILCLFKWIIGLVT